MLRYYKLFDLLMRKGMKKTELLKVISSGSLAKLGKGENIQTEIIEKICDFLECQPGDIMENVHYDSEIDELGEKHGILEYADENGETVLVEFTEDVLGLSPEERLKALEKKYGVKFENGKMIKK